MNYCSIQHSFSRETSLRCFFLFLFFFSFFTHPLYAQEFAWEDYENFEVIDRDTTWSDSFTQNDVYKSIAVVNGATLTIEAGTEVNIGQLTVYNGRIVAKGSFSDPIILSKMESSQGAFSEGYDRECNHWAIPQGTIEFFDTANSEDDLPSYFEYVVFDTMGRLLDKPELNCPTPPGFDGGDLFPSVDKKDPVIRFVSGQVELKSVAFRDSAYEDIHVEMEISQSTPSFDYLRVRDSDFYGNNLQTALSSSLSYPDTDDERDYSLRVLLSDNWYGSSDGPTAPENPEGKGKKLTGIYHLDGWSESEFGLEKRCEDCSSNILFLPGLKASRLYTKQENAGENRRWIPNLWSDDAEHLLLDESGKSIQTVYTKEVLDSVITGNIYETFLEKMSAWKSEGKIEDYRAFAYDWRMNVESLVREGVLYPNSVTRSLTDDFLSLAGSSKTGKVTIIAHSNGGLLAKALLLELGKQGKSDLAETVVFVASPQMGTPLSVLSLLYGYDEPIPGMISQEEARRLAEYMPGAYGLLPTREYFTSTDTPFIHFISERTRYAQYRDTYGKGIETYDELISFLSASQDRRSDPKAEAIDEENVLSKSLLEEADFLHRRLARWKNGDSTRVIQIAGWGLDTVSGVKYEEKEAGRCYGAPGQSVPSCTGLGEYEPTYEPIFTIDGDGIVTDPSAVMISEGESIERYWVNLLEYNNETIFDRKHRDILEVHSVLEFLEMIVLKSDPLSYPRYISQNRPDHTKENTSRIRLSLYSPLDMHLFDSEGRHTGPQMTPVDSGQARVEETALPGSSYFEFGDRKYASLPNGTQALVELRGYGAGHYTLSLEEVEERDGKEVVTKKLTYAFVPTSSQTKASIDIPEGGLSSDMVLKNDYDGDGPGQTQIFLSKTASGTQQSIFTASTKDDTNNDDETGEEKTTTRSASKYSKNTQAKLPLVTPYDQDFLKAVNPGGSTQGMPQDILSNDTSLQEIFVERGDNWFSLGKAGMVSSFLFALCGYVFYRAKRYQDEKKNILYTGKIKEIFKKI